MDSQYCSVKIDDIGDDMKLKDLNAAKLFSSPICNGIYDVLAACISLADVITDIIILIQFYVENRMIFFYISLAIIILANLSYVIVFMKRYNSGPTFIALICVLCILLPIAPLLSFIMYFMHDGNSCISKCMIDNFLFLFGFDMYSFYTDDTNSHLQQWYETKVSKHIGFICEALFESIPQTILQMIAIVYYNQLNMVFFISIILSMLSISTKSLVFSSSISITNKTMFYTWISAISDFFAMFMIISWIFYSNQMFDDALHLIQMIWIYKTCIFVVPLCLFISIGVFIKGYSTIIWYYAEGNCCCVIFVWIVAFIGITILWVFGMFLGVIGLEVCCFMYLAYMIFSIGHGRIPHTKSNKIWLNILDFIKNESISYDTDIHSETRNFHVTQKQDKIVRICSINRQLLLMKNSNPNLHQFLTIKEHETQFRDVTYSDIRKNTFKAENVGLLRWRFINWYSAFYYKSKKTYQYRNNPPLVIFVWILLYILFPWYCISRVITVLFPYIILIILYSYSSSFYHEIDVFQMLMLLIYCFFQILIIILLIINYEDEHIIFHLAPELNGSNCLYKYLDDTFYFMCKSYYNRLILKPIILSILCNIFQDDIGKLIFQFIPFYLDEEQYSQLLIAKAAQYTAQQNRAWKHPLIVAAFRK